MLRHALVLRVMAPGAPPRRAARQCAVLQNAMQRGVPEQDVVGWFVARPSEETAVRVQQQAAASQPAQVTVSQATLPAVSRSVQAEHPAAHRQHR